MKRIIITILLGSVGNLLFAQSDTAVLKFEEAIKIGLQNNVNLNTQRNQLYVTEARRLQGYASYLPNLNGQAFVQRTDGLQIDPTTGGASNVTADYVQGTVSSNLVLFNGFNRINTVRQNNNQFFAQDAFVKRSKQDAVFNVTSQYLQVLLDQELLRIAEENMNAQRVITEQTKGFVDVGSRAATDEYNANALLQNFHVTYLRAKMALENDRSLLAQTLQLDPSIPFKVVQPEYSNSAEYFKTLSLDSLYQIALQNRQDLKQQNYLVEASNYGFKAASSGYYPTLSLFASYGSTYFKNSASPNAESFREQFTHLNPSLSYGVNLTIPLFDRLVTRTNRITSRVAYDNAILTRDNLRKTIKIDVQRSFKNYETAIDSYKASMVQFEAAELALKTQQESYDLGISTQVALAQANQIFVQAASSRAQAEVTLVFQQMLLEYALGTLQVESLYQDEN